MEIIACPSCGTRVRIPTDRGRLKVKCPKCSTAWYHPEAVEYCDVSFRCARDGADFKITLKRYRPSEQFKIDRIYLDNSSHHHKTIAPADHVGEAPVASRMQYAASEYDWSGFYCPCCGYIPDGPSNMFVQCGRCGELVCQSNVFADSGSNVRFYKCYPACGSGGEITGSIQSYESNRSLKTSAPQFSKLPGHNQKIEPPRETLTSPKRLDRYR